MIVLLSDPMRRREFREVGGVQLLIRLLDVEDAALLATALSLGQLVCSPDDAEAMENRTAFAVRLSLSLSLSLFSLLKYIYFFSLCTSEAGQVAGVMPSLQKIIGVFFDSEILIPCIAFLATICSGSIPFLVFFFFS
jgi:hypothetical protein